MKLVPCKAEGCNTIVADSREEYCRICRAKRASVKQEEPKPSQPVAGADEIPDDYFYKALVVSPPRPVGTVLGFSIPGGQTGRRYLFQMPQRPFRGKGIIIWSTDPASKVHELRVGNQNLLLAGPVPASFFGSAKNFAEVDAQIQAGKYPPSAIGPWPTCNLGTQITLEVEGGIDDACVWGLMIP